MIDGAGRVHLGKTVAGSVAWLIMLMTSPDTRGRPLDDARRYAILEGAAHSIIAPVRYW